MTDNSSLISNTVGLVSNLMYNLKASAPISRAMQTSVPASNACLFVAGQTMIFQVPSGRRGTFLDGANSLLRFSIKNNDISGNISFDNFGASAIKRIDIFCGSALLETIQQANVSYSYLSDFQITLSGRAGVSTAYGFNRSGNRYGSPIFAGQTQTFAIPLLSGLFMQSDKFTPLNLLADDICIEITLENNTACCYSATSTYTWSVVSAEMELNIFELQTEGYEMVNSMTPFNEPIFISSSSFRHYVSFLQSASSGGFSFLVPARFASVMSLIVCPRPASTQIQTAYSICSRANSQIASYFWRVGSYILPNKNVVIQSGVCGGYAEAFMEVVKSFLSLGSPNQAAGLDASLYQVADVADTTVGGCSTGGVTAFATGGNSYQNAFALALETEVFSCRGDTLLSGLNSLSSNCFFEGYFNNATTSLSCNYTIDFFANYDFSFELRDGLLTAKY